MDYSKLEHPFKRYFDPADLDWALAFLQRKPDMAGTLPKTRVWMHNCIFPRLLDVIQGQQKVIMDMAIGQSKIMERLLELEKLNLIPKEQKDA